MTTNRTRIRAGIAALALLVVVLAACAPTAAGDAARVDYREGATYAVPAGSSLFVVLDLTLEEAGLTADALRRMNLTWVPLGIRGDSANASRLVTLPTAEAPEDWDVRLWQARVLRERPLGERDATFSYRLEVELRVDVPTSAEGLIRRIRGQLRMEGGATLPLDFLVRAD